ncbi:hypothetical protein ACQP1P_16205 [Dactylosporangium sp. CA-052675]|uniref:hypothetical protein n=1 Tax=Dactylosporangium sp. CA-052675 TaxID=3239927 RepID=UPI003D8EDEDB
MITSHRWYDVRTLKLGQWLIGAAVATVLAMLGWLALPVVTIVWCLHDLNRCTTGHPGMSEVQEVAEIKLPKDARLRYSFYSQWLEWELYAIVAFPSDETDRFLADNAVPPPSTTSRVAPDGINVVGDEDRQPAWHPELVNSYAGVHACTTTTCRDPMLDKDDARITVLYIHVLSDDQPAPTPS